MFRKCFELISQNGIRSYRRSTVPVLREMKYRRNFDKFAKPQRSALIEWDMDRELKVFNRRFGLEPTEQQKISLCTESYVIAENERRHALGLEPLPQESNAEMAAQGLESLRKILTEQIRELYPLIPDQAVEALTDHVCSEEQLKNTALNMGLTPFILRDGRGQSVPEEQLLHALLALFAATKNQKFFSQRYFLVHLCGVDVMDIWNPSNATILLNELLKQQNMEPFEARIIAETGRNTLLEALFYVGVYSNKQMIGKSSGGSQSEALELAVRDALRRKLKLARSERSPFERLALAHIKQKQESQLPAS